MCVVGIVAIDGVAPAVVFDQAVHCPKPHETGLILMNRINEIVRDALFEREMIEAQGKILRAQKAGKAEYTENQELSAQRHDGSG